MNPSRSLLLVPVLAVTLLCEGCRPKHAPPAFISDGAILLLRSGVTNAAVVVTKQSMFPEVVDYTWFLRSDGAATFEATNQAVASGSAKGAKSITFGSFNIEWSSAGTAGGYVYYPETVHSLRAPWGQYYRIPTLGGPSMAVTTERHM